MNRKEQLIQKLFSNQCSKQELNLLFELIHNDDSETTPEVLMTLLQEMGKVPALDATTSDRILSRVLENTNEKELPSKGKIFRLKPSNRIRQIGKVAAVVLLFVSTSLFVFQHLNPSQLIAKTAFGERKEITLPDGSVVTLNGNSTLRYFADWSEEETRVVQLQGEAYFKVEKKEALNTKFQVLTKDLTVEILGTVFNVNTRLERTRVFLEEGKVKLNLEDQTSSEIFLKPGEVVSFSAKRKLLLSPQKIANELEVSWKDGYLIFEDTSLQEILEKLTSTTNFEFEIETAALAKRTWNIALPNDNINEAISIISKTTGTLIQKNGNKFIIQQKPKG
jgi:transmembrane sensor